MTTIGYIRQSKRADLDVALSYDAQLAAIHRLAERDRIDPTSVIIFADMGRSGAAGKEKLRPAYLEALALMESDGVEAIYTLSLTRLARSAGELERVADICETRGIRLVTDKEGVHDPRNPMQSALFGMIGVFAKFERELAVQRAHDNVAVRRARGERMGRAPYGERPGEDAQAVVAAWNATHSLNGAARLLNDAHVRSALGRDWSGVAVRNVLSREAPETMAPQRARRGAKPSSPFLLYGLLRCHCRPNGPDHPGRILTASRDGRGNREPTYRCHASDTLPNHPRPTRIRESALLPWIQAEVERFRPPGSDIVRDATNDAERARLETDRAYIIDNAIIMRLDPAELARRLAEVDAKGDALATATAVAVLEPIDWQAWAPADINLILSKMWAYVELGPDLLPVRAEWRVPREYV